MTRNLLIEVLSLLPALNKHDLALVRGAVDRLLGQGGQQGPLYDAVMAATGSKISYGAFLQSGAGKGWANREKAVMAFIAATWPKLTKVQEVAMTKFLVARLADDLKARKINVSVGSLSRMIGTIPEIFDACFPGYREAGMAHLVLKVMIK
jgi:hypothetical protein